MSFSNTLADIFQRQTLLMRISNSIILLCLSVLVGCGRPSTERRGVSELRIRTGDGAFDYTVHHSFQFKDTVRHIGQELGIMSMASDSIKFVLVTIGDGCEMHFAGYAINNYPEAESTNKASGETDTFREYVTEGEQYIMKIRIELSSKRANILYQSKQEEKRDGCVLPLERTMNAIIW